MVRSTLSLCNENFQVQLSRGVEHSDSLLKLADGLSIQLNSKGVKPGECVVIQTSNPLKLWLAVMALWSIGAVPVPTDPKVPSTRLQSIREICRSRFTLVDSKEDDLKNIFDVRFSETRPPELGLSSDIAYVLFTSGSTGVPKGVVVSHDALISRLIGFSSCIDVTDSDTIAGLAHPIFDVSMLEILLPSLTGCTFALPPASVRGNPVEIASWLNNAHPTIIHGSPTLFQLLLHSKWNPDKDMALWVGGETLPTNLAHVLGRASRSMWNFYGPTETTIVSTLWNYDGSIEGPSAPIGWAIPGTYVRLDSDSTSKVGELIISGSGLAEGYLSNGAKSSRSFVQNGDLREYQTGDICQKSESGCFTFLHRVDNQVKISGVRIELGDIEANLLNCSEVRQALVIAFPFEHSGGQRLAAGVVSSAPVSQIRIELSRRIPRHYLPSSIIQLDSLPLTVTGKIDRAAGRELIMRKITRHSLDF